MVQTPPANRAPVAAADKTLTMDEDATNTALGITAPTDADGNSLTISVTAVPSGGTLATADGTAVTTSTTLTISQLTGLVFTPDANLNDDTTSFGTFTYTVSDGSLTDTGTVTISVTPVNDAPELVGVMEFAIDENTTAVADITATDVDTKDTLTYSITGGDDQSFFTIDASTGALNFVSRPDFESPEDTDQDNIYSVQVTVSDGNGGSASQTYVITVNDVITHVAITNTAIDENDAGAIVGTLSAAIDDINATHSYTYSLTGADADSFEVVDGQLKLKDGIAANYEVKNSYAVTVTATDTGGLSTSQDFTVTINDINDAPTDLALSRTGLMNNTDGAVVGTLTTTDEDAVDSHTYTVSDDRFEVTSAGVLKLKNGNTIDNLVEQTITLTVTSTDQGDKIIQHEFILTVGTVQITASTFEENAAGVIIGTLSVIDPDFTANIIYTLSGTGSENFEVVDGQLKLKDGIAANYEVLSSYSITITATDDAGHEKATTYPFQVTDVNESPTDMSLSSTATDENSAGAVFGDLTTTDEDIGDSHTYTLSGADADSFEVVDGQLKLKDEVSANYEVQNSYSVTVTTTDSGGLSTSKDFTVTINDINDKPTAVNLSGSLYVNENVAGGIVGNLTTTDEDAGDEHEYTLSGADAVYFEVVNNQLKLKDDINPVYANQSSYNVTVTSTDSGGEAITESYIVEVNATPTDISLSSNSVNESSYGLSVGTIIATDPNSDDEFTYSITGGADQDYFEIDSSGVLKLKDNKFADFEVDDTLTVNITVTDQGGLSFEKTFNISVNDLAYATPYVSDIRPQSIPSSGNDIIDNLLLGFSIDYDHDPSTPLTITYSLIGTNSAFAFYYGDLYDALGDQFTDRIENGSAAWEALVDQAFAYWGEITGINFVKVEETATQCGDIRVGLQSSWAPDTQGPLGFSFANTSYASAAYDVWFLAYFDPENSDFDPRRETPEFVLIHEIGHSLGLAHPHDDSGDSTAIFDPWLTDAHTVMSYSGRGHILKNWDIDGDGTYEYEYWDAISAVSPSIYDIKTIQYIYGMTPDLNGEDNNYVFSGPVFKTIYDTGGQDTIDLSSYSLNITLDLTPGTVSYIGTDEIYVSYYWAPIIDDYTHGNTGFPISIAEGTIIEDAITGSGDDSITCNVAVNFITCGLGDDTVMAISSGDSIYGGGGDDWFYISEANFTIIDGGAGNDSLLLKSIGSSFNLSDFTDAQITGIENIDIQWGSATLLTLTKQSILDLNGVNEFDLDGDGNNDYVTWILGDSGQDNILLNDEGWSRDSNVSSHSFTVHGFPLEYDYYYTNDNGDTYFATSKGVGVYVKTSDGDVSITDQTVAENRADATVGILSKDGLTKLSPFGSLFTVSGPDADKFEVDIDGTTLRLKTGTVVDYETQTTYNITITVLEVSTDYQITVIDGEENDIEGQHWLVASSETITGTTADDFIDYKGGNDTIDGKGGNDILVINHDKTSAFEILTAGGITKIKVGSSAGVDYRYDDVKMVNVESIKFNDRYVALNTESPSYETIIWGTSSSEDLTDVTDGDDLIDSAGGNDYINGKNGNDTLVIFSSSSNFEIVTLAGLTKIYGDTYVSGLGSAYWLNTIRLNNVETIMFADDQTMSLEVNSIGGNYIFWGATYSETISGTDEDDVIDSGGGSDVINGGTAGDDTLLLFADKADFEIVTLAGLTKIYGLDSTGLAGAYWLDTIRMHGVETIMFADDQTMDLDVYSIGGNYIFWGATYSETISGTDEDDVIDSGGGSDVINGGTGDDTLLLFADRSTFDITVSGDTITLVGNSSEGLAGAYWLDTITMTNVETIMFADQTVPVSELTSSASANAADDSTDDDSDSPTTPSDDDDTPVTPTNDDPLPELPDLSLFVNDFALGSITLPETVVTMEDSTLPDLSDLVGLLGDQTESLALDFDQVDTGNPSPVLASIESIKPVALDWTAQTDPFIESDWNPIIEELYYTAEFG